MSIRSLQLDYPDSAIQDDKCSLNLFEHSASLCVMLCGAVISFAILSSCMLKKIKGVPTPNISHLRLNTKDGKWLEFPEHQYNFICQSTQKAD